MKKKDDRQQTRKNEQDSLSKLWEKARSESKKCIFCPKGKPKYKMVNGHIISRNRLDLIAQKNMVHHYHMDMMHFVNMVQKQVNEKKEAENKKTPPAPITIPPLSPKKGNITRDHCTEKFTCTYHDIEAFKLADKPKNDLDPYDPQTQLQLRIRSVAAYATLLESYNYIINLHPWRINDTHKNKGIALMLNSMSKLKIPQSHTTKLAKTELNFWKTTYKKLSDTEILLSDEIVSSVRQVNKKLRIAGTGIQQRNGHTIVVTILPQEQERCTIIATGIRKPQHLLEIEANEIEQILSQETLTKIIEKLVIDSSWVFLYISPEDYSKISKEDQTRLEERIAESYSKWQEKIPERYTQKTRSQLRRSRRNRKSWKRQI